MSVVLKALRKAEQDKGKISLQPPTKQEPQVPKRGRIWPLRARVFVVAGGAFVLLALVHIIRSDQDQRRHLADILPSESLISESTVSSVSETESPHLSATAPKPAKDGALLKDDQSMERDLRKAEEGLIGKDAGAAVGASGEQIGEPAPVVSEDVPAGQEMLTVANFDKGTKPNILGGDFGAWDRDPDDDTQTCSVFFDGNEDALGNPDGYSLRLEYDVESPNPAYNGFWMALNDLDASVYNTLSFYVKGDAEAGHASRVKLELKDADSTSAYMLSGVGDEWRRVDIPLDKFYRVKDWTALREFVIVFEDTNSRPQTGTIYIDHITFTKM